MNQTIVTFDTVTDITPGFWRWPHFSPQEWACRGTGKVGVVPEFMDELETVRAMYGAPLPISSGYRSPEHNEEVSATQSTDGAHTLALAADFLIHGTDALHLLALLLARGWQGIGIGQKGPVEKRILHADMAPAKDGAPRPWLWTY